MPTAAEMEQSLRNVVKARSRNPGDEPPTVNSIRAESEKELGLEAGFYKTGDWKSRSKEIIQDQFGRADDPPISGVEEEKKKTKPVKRPSHSAASDKRPNKKSKLDREEDDDESTALSEPPESEEEEVPKKKQRRTASKPAGKPKLKSKPRKDVSDEEQSDAPSMSKEDSEDEVKPIAKAQDHDDTSSELSSLIDEPEPTKKKRAKNGEAKPPRPSKPPAKAKSKPAAESDANTEEIKKLQGWLVKCGIRKVWGKELKPYETPKAKIAHLKSMLADVGMTGRYSNEKAASIKERRELEADIEAVQEGNERWGKNSVGEQDGDDDRPRRRLIRGAQNYDFLSSDGEETD